jgi:hypothetical protein
MPANARRHSLSCSTRIVGPLRLAVVAVGAFATAGSPAFALKIPIQATDTQAKDLKEGRWYFNLHSTKIPGGEIRGPVVRR